MLLYLLRHADADTQAATDDLRPLSDKGHEQAAKVARFCESRGLVPEIVLTSPLVRAFQTAERVAGHLAVELITAPFLASGMHPEEAVRELRGYERFASVMIVGHEPDFSSLAGHLLGITGSGHVHIRKASLTLLELGAVRAASARLEFALPCKLL